MGVFYLETVGGFYLDKQEDKHSLDTEVGEFYLDTEVDKLGQVVGDGDVELRDRPDTDRPKVDRGGPCTPHIHF